jgi:hypothetical protein
MNENKDLTSKVDNPTREKTGGRQKGTPNKVNATVKDNVLAVFNRLGGTAQMATWATENQTEFYRLYARLIPTELNQKTEHSGEVQYKWLDDGK